MTRLEDQLREALRERATRPRLGADVIGNAIRRAHAFRRRRAALGIGGVVVAVIVAVSGVALGRPDAAGIVPTQPSPTQSSTPSPTSSPSDSAVPQPSDSPSPGPTEPLSSIAVPVQHGPSSTAAYGVNLDVLESTGVLRTRDGLEYSFDNGYGSIAAVPAGWVYRGLTGRDLTLLRYDGTAITLPGTTFDPSQQGLVFSADGQQLAWTGGNQLHAAHLDGNGLHDEISSPAPYGSAPVTWIGGNVVVRTEQAGAYQFDVWNPTHGDFSPQWTTGYLAVYGPVPPGTAAYAHLAGSPDAGGCLGRVNGVQSMSLIDTVCPTGLRAISSLGLLSPDGQHIADETTGTAFSIMVMDIRTMSQPQAAPYTCAGQQALAWEDNTHLLAYSNQANSVVRCDLSTGESQTVSGTNGSFHTGAEQLVLRYGV
jgi:hypothetical protein